MPRGSDVKPTAVMSLGAAAVSSLSVASGSDESKPAVCGGALEALFAGSTPDATVSLTARPADSASQEGGTSHRGAAGRAVLHL